jgi:hypothetical protein
MEGCRVADLPVTMAYSPSLASTSVSEHRAGLGGAEAHSLGNARAAHRRALFHQPIELISGGEYLRVARIVSALEEPVAT